MTRRLYTTEEVAEMFAMEPAGIRRKIRQGEIQAVNIGSNLRPIYRISASELDRYERANAA